MPLLTYARYVTLTGDTASASATIEEQIDVAEQEVERFLDRPLAEGLYTDSLVVYPSGRAYPKAVPLVSVPVTATYEIEDEVTLKSVAAAYDLIVDYPDVGWDGYAATSGRVALTYTGGWTAQNVPLAVARAIALITYGLAHPQVSSAPPGATSVKVGDVSVSYAGGPPADPLDEVYPGASRLLAPYRWRG